MAGQSEIDRVRDATDLVQLIGEHIPLTPKGREHLGVCPFHDDHKPSLTVVTHKGNAFYKCFSCGATGDAFNFVMQYHRKDFAEALRYLADRAGIALQPRNARPAAPGEPSRADIRKANEFAARFFRQTLDDPDAGRAGREFIARRGISEAMVETFQIGLAPNGWDGLVSRLGHKASAVRTAVAAGLIQPRTSGSGHYDVFRHRVIFPICDELGVPVAFGGRTLDADEPAKYLNSAESPVFSKSRVLYGLHAARQPIINADLAIVTEGYTDVIACHQAGLANTVGTLGTALTRGQARLLSRLCHTVTLVFDGDEAGRRAADRAVEVFFHEPVDVKICVLPEGVDPDELLRQPDGLASFQAALADAFDALGYKFDRFREQIVGQSTISGREKILGAFLQELANLGFGALQGVRKRGVLLRLADLLGLPVEEIQRMIPRRRMATAPARESAAPAAAEAPIAPSLLGTDEVGPGLSRARRMAERHLLGLLIFEPDLARRPVVERGEDAMSVVQAFAPADFQDGAAARIAAIVLPWLAGGAEVTVPRLHAALDDEHCRQVASKLYFDGQAACGESEETALAAVRGAAEALEASRRRHEFEEQVRVTRQGLGESNPGAVQAVHDLLEQRRQQSHRPGAISQGVRAST